MMSSQSVGGEQIATQVFSEQPTQLRVSLSSVRDGGTGALEHFAVEQQMRLNHDSLATRSSRLFQGGRQGRLGHCQKPRENPVDTHPSGEQRRKGPAVINRTGITTAAANQHQRSPLAGRMKEVCCCEALGSQFEDCFVTLERSGLPHL
jgi:hypothetical protein